MARIRSIHSDALKSEKLAKAGAEAERCYWRLAVICDDEGRTEDNARLIWATLFPLNDDASTDRVEGWLRDLERVGLILRYQINGQRYLSVTRWRDYQKPQHPTPSKIPGPELATAKPEHPHEDSRRALHGVGVGEGEGVGEGGEKEASTSLMVVPVPSSVFFDDFWATYPRRIGKRKAEEAYERALKRADSGTIIEGARALAAQGIETKFIPHPTTWLNRDGWEDDHTTAPRMPRGADATARSLEWKKGQG